MGCLLKSMLQANSKLDCIPSAQLGIAIHRDIFQMARQLIDQCDREIGFESRQLVVLMQTKLAAIAKRFRGYQLPDGTPWADNYIANQSLVIDTTLVSQESETDGAALKRQRSSSEGIRAGGHRGQTLVKDLRTTATRPGG